MKPLVDTEAIPEEELEQLTEKYSHTDPITLYLNELKKFSRLNAEQEYLLWGELDAGRQAAARLVELEKALNGGSSLHDDPKEIKLLQSKVKVGLRAKQQFIESALPLVVFYAKKYAGKLSLLDLIQEGNIALMRASERYEYMESSCFATMAGIYIKNSMWEAVRKSNTIHMPAAVSQAIRRLEKVSDCIFRELGHSPSTEEIAQEMNMSLDLTNEILEAANSAADPYSLDMPVGEIDGDGCIGDFIPDVAASPEETVIQSMLHEKVIEVLGTLDPTEERVIRLRFGIEDGYSLPIEEVCRECQANKEEVIRAEIMALRKLRHPSRSRKLQGFLC